MSEGFVKLFDSILDSSVWGEPAPTVKVWITLLLKANRKGIVLSSLPGLARAAVVSRKQCEQAIAILTAPDPDSRTPDNDGRRIEAVDGGWQITNHKKYRELRTDKQKSDAERQRRHRENEASVVTERDNGDVTVSHAPYADGDAEAEAYGRNTKTTSSPVSLDSVAAIFPNPARALPMLVGMTNGLNTPGGRGVPAAVLAEAATELSAVGGDVTPHRFKAFVRKVLERANAPRGQPRTTDRASRGVQALGTWLAESEIPDAEVVPNGEQ